MTMTLCSYDNNRDLPGKNTSIDVVPRSRLYSIPPVDIETSWIESLTGYISRLAWTYRVEPRVLVAQEIMPRLSRPYHFQSSHSLLGAYCRSEAMSIDGAGETALDWASTLTRLTLRERLGDLTLSSWARSLPSKGLLRTTPAWCPVCYQEWRRQGLPIYQPLLWMFQVVTVCLQHRRQLEERCPHCRRKQSVIPARMQPGCCTQCMAWLGKTSSSETQNEVDAETLDWQQWAVNTIGELHKTGITSGDLPWEQLANGLALCSEIVGSSKQLASLAGISKQLLSSWQNHRQVPSFERMLGLCYALDISPLLLMSGNREVLKGALQNREIHHKPRPSRKAPQSVDREQSLALIQAVLDGQEVPIGVRQLEKRLGLGARTLIYHFPQLCALITVHYQSYRAEQARQRREQACSEVHQATLILYAEGINPSARHVAKKLPDSGVMRTPKGLSAWHSARRDLGLES
jgi:transcriptional regulator with XRE-family HTH domain